MISTNIIQMTCARIPTDLGIFQLCYYRNNQDEKEHLALVFGDIEGKNDVFVRVHSECFTGDVLGSRRCDCGPQLKSAMQMIAQEGAGVIIYLRQEGRGIGLLDKLRAYNLQDEGFDTVDANLILGHQADGRDYTVAALILRDLGVSSIQLLTNNPLKIESLRQLGVQVNTRIPLQTGVNHDNLAYLRAKAEKMHHLLDLDIFSPGSLDKKNTTTIPDEKSGFYSRRPFITLSYAQSLDGSITTKRGVSLPISGPETLEMTHRLRAEHDAILVGIGAVLTDDPRLTVRLVDGHDPQPIILDSHLRFPLRARLLQNKKPPWIITTNQSSPDRQKDLEAVGARVTRLPENSKGQIPLDSLMNLLDSTGIRSLMVEGGAAIISSFLQANLVDRLVLTIAPIIVGGLKAVVGDDDGTINHFPTLQKPRYEQIGNDIVVLGEVVKNGYVTEI